MYDRAVGSVSHLNILTFEYMDIWIYGDLNIYGHLNVCPFKCVHIQIYGQSRCVDIQMYDLAEGSVSQLIILTFEYKDIWIYGHLNIWTFEHLNVWTFKCMDI